jgi:hypothetical protein
MSRTWSGLVPDSNVEEFVSKLEEPFGVSSWKTFVFEDAVSTHGELGFISLGGAELERLVGSKSMLACRKVRRTP